MKRDLPEVLNSLEKTLILRPSDARTRLQTGIIYHQLGRHRDAQEAFERVVTESPDMVDGHYHLGRVLMELKEFTRAELCFRAALERKENHPQSLQALARLELARDEETRPRHPVPPPLEPSDQDGLTDDRTTQRHVALLERADEDNTKTLVRRSPSPAGPSGPEASPEPEGFIVPLYRRKGEQLQELGRWQEALEFYEDALDHDRNASDIWYKVAQCHYELQEPDRARRAAQKAAHLTQRQSHEDNGTEEERAILRKTGTRALALLGTLAAERKDWEESAACYEKVVFQDPDAPQALIALSTARLWLDEAPGALTVLLRAVELAPGDAQVHFLLGCAYDLCGQADDAIESLTCAVELNADHDGARYRLGQIHQNRGHLESARQAYVTALRQNPELTEAQRGLAQVYLQQGAAQKSLTLWQHLCKSHPDDLSLCQGYGTALAAAGQTDEALAVLKKTLHAKPTAEVYRSLADCYEELDQPREMILALQRCAELEPDDEQLQIRMGLALRDRNEALAAVDHLRRALKLGGPNSAARRPLAELCGQLGHKEAARGDREKAISWYRQALDIEKELPEIRRALRLIETRDSEPPAGGLR
jgi:tetratricopeptide (TPR) repeat protein